ncbi:hypothetical protein CKA32_005349 [Geitlerinema sp. FC II]|nr:hypothetical protein CKA32_005349 [Geitlerinema sp. FC II]
MAIAHLQTFLTRPISQIPRFVTGFWFALSLAASSFYSLPVASQALSHEYLVSDDGRQHLFWMRRFLDSGLFPKDAIADYFQSVAPLGYQGFYWIFAQLGIDPLDVAKIIPFPLAVLATGFAFGLTLEIFPIPSAAFFSSVLLIQNLWMRDDLASASARAFLNPLFLAFLYFLIRRKTPWMLLSLLGVGYFYPQYLLVAAGVLLLFPRNPLQNLLFPGSPSQRGNAGGEDSVFFGGNLFKHLPPVGNLLALALCGAILLPYALKSSDFGSAFSLVEARHLPEFQPGGRTAYFAKDWGRFWLSGSRTGLQPALDPPLLCLGLLLPLWLRGRSPLKSHLHHIYIVSALVISSLMWFFLAHLLAFRLHLPSRYTQHSLRIAIAIAAGIAIVWILESLWGWAKPSSQRFRGGVAVAVTVAIFGYLAAYPFSLGNYPKTNYIVGSHPQLYEFFQQQPKDTLIASLSPEANNLPSFAQRSIFVGYEYAIPFHRGYYNLLRQRAIALLEAHYTPDEIELRQFVEAHDIDFFLIDADAFSPEYLLESRWRRSYPQQTDEIRRRLLAGETPALQGFLETCGRFYNEDRTENLAVVAKSCIVKAELK